MSMTSRLGGGALRQLLEEIFFLDFQIQASSLAVQRQRLAFFITSVRWADEKVKL